MRHRGEYILYGIVLLTTRVKNQCCQTKPRIVNCCIYSAMSLNKVRQARIRKLLNLWAQLYKLSGWAGGANSFCYLTYKGEQGACAGCAPSKSAPVNSYHTCTSLFFLTFWYIWSDLEIRTSETIGLSFTGYNISKIHIWICLICPPNFRLNQMHLVMNLLESTGPSIG